MAAVLLATVIAFCTVMFAVMIYSLATTRSLDDINVNVFLTIFLTLAGIDLVSSLVMVRVLARDVRAFALFFACVLGFGLLASLVPAARDPRSFLILILAVLGVALVGGLVFAVSRRAGAGPPREFVGRVRGYRERQDARGMVASFLLDRYDGDGNLLTPSISVEMRGRQTEGQLDEGDQVQVRGRWREGEVMKVKELFDRTKQIHVRAA